MSVYYNTCYTSPFLNKNGLPLVCFHPIWTYENQILHDYYCQIVANEVCDAPLVNVDILVKLNFLKDHIFL